MDIEEQRRIEALILGRIPEEDREGMNDALLSRQVKVTKVEGPVEAPVVTYEYKGKVLGKFEIKTDRVRVTSMREIVEDP